MLSRRIFETDFARALQDELARQDMSVRDLADRAGIPPATLYKLTSGKADPRLSTVRRIVSVLEPREKSFIAVIAARFLLDDLDNRDLTIGEQKYRIRGIVDCPVAIIKPQQRTLIEAIETLAKRV